MLNDTKPYGHILDFRGQQDAVDAAIALFSGAKADQAREIWLVDKAPVGHREAQDRRRRPRRLHEVAGPRPASPRTWPTSRATTPAPRSSSSSRKCSGSRPSSTSTPTSPTSRKQTIEQILPKDELNAFRGVYLETAQRLKEQQGKAGRRQSRAHEVDQLDFEFVLFASAVIDYDYIMGLIARFSEQDAGQADDEPRAAHRPDRSPTAKFMDEREDITDYVRSLKAGEGLDEAAIRDGYQRFKAEKDATRARRPSPHKHGLPTDVAASLRRHHPAAA